MKIIDISQFNGAIDFSKVKKEVDGVIVRAGYRGYGKGSLAKDIRFNNNAAGANANKIPLGVYFVTQAINTDEAEKEALFVLDMVKSYSLDLPIFIDSEDCNFGNGRADHGKLARNKRTAIVNAFCKTITNHGYKAGVYASEYWFKTYMNYKELNGFLWVAKYSAIEPSIKWNAWQFTDRGRVNGISGNVDISNFEEATPGTKKTNEEIADEVIAGKWGNGEDRKTLLTAAGYDYNAIQKIVNSKVKPKATKEYYTIKKGDTLTAIAKKYGTTINKLKTLNSIKNANMIYAGQKIRIK